MKRLINILVMAILLMAIGMPVFATDEVVLTLRANNQAITGQSGIQKISLNGSAQLGNKKLALIEILIKVEKVQDNEIVYIQQLNTDQNGLYQCDFNLPVKGSIQDYRAVVIASDLDKTLAGSLGGSTLYTTASPVNNSGNAPIQPPVVQQPVTQPPVVQNPVVTTPVTQPFVPPSTQIGNPVSTAPVAVATVTAPIKETAVKVIDVKVIENVDEETIAKSSPAVNLVKEVTKAPAVPTVVKQPTVLLKELTTKGIMPKTTSLKTVVTQALLGDQLSKMLQLKTSKKITGLVALKNAGYMKGITINEKEKLTKAQLIDVFASIYKNAAKVKFSHKSLKVDKQLKTTTQLKAEALKVLNASNKGKTVNVKESATMTDFIILMDRLLLKK